jgi:DNA-binding NarL/FixJ family response regulator
MKKRVLLVDRTLALKNEIDQVDDKIQNYVVVDMHANVRDAYLSLLRSRPDIIVFSMHESDEAMVKTIGKIKNQYPSIHLIIQSEIEDDRLFLDLLSIGIAGFIPHQRTWMDLEKHLDEIVNADIQANQSVVDHTADVFHLKLSPSTNRLEIARLMFSGRRLSGNF